MEKLHQIQSNTENACKVCHSNPSIQPQKNTNNLSPLLSFIILFLPKCPFCIVAYSSSMTMCGAAPLVSHHIDWGAWLAIGLSIIVLGSIALNFRGKGTYYALFIALIGSLMVVFGIFKANMMLFY
jgi:hypothetical protein